MMAPLFVPANNLYKPGAGVPRAGRVGHADRVVSAAPPRLVARSAPPPRRPPARAPPLYSELHHAQDRLPAPHIHHMKLSVKVAGGQLAHPTVSLGATLRDSSSLRSRTAPTLGYVHCLQLVLI